MAVNPQKFLPQGKKGGALAPRPSSAITSSKFKGVEEEKVNTRYKIKESLVTIRDLLGDRFAQQKEDYKDEKIAKEREARKKGETKLETPTDPDDKKIPKKLVPKLSFLDGIKKFLGNILIGWIAIRLLEFLPKIIPILKRIGKIADFIIDFGGKILDGLITFVDWGYKALDATKKWIGDKFGDGAAQKFTQFTSLMTGMMNKIFILGMTIVAFADALGGVDWLGLIDRWKKIIRQAITDGPRKTARRLSIWAQRKAGRHVRQLVRPIAKGIKHFGGSVAEVGKKKLVDPVVDLVQKRGPQIIDAARKTKVGKSIEGVVEQVKNIKPKVVIDTAVQNLKQSKAGKVVNEVIEGVGENLVKRKKQIVELSKRGTELFVGAKKTGAGLLDNTTRGISKGWSWLLKKGKNIWAGILEKSGKVRKFINKKLAGWGDEFMKLGARAKEAFMKRILTPIMTFLGPLFKKITGIGDTITNLLRKIPGFDNILSVLKKKGAKGIFDVGPILKQIGPKALDIIGGVINLLFSYDRFAAGDTVGGVIEGASGLLDLSALPPPLGPGFLPGPKISLGLDAYMFARDILPEFFPEADLQKGEDELIKKVGLGGFKSNLDNIFSKLPSLSEIGNFMGLGKKDEGSKDSTQAGEGSGVDGLEGGDSTKENIIANNVQSSEGEGSEKFLPVDVNSVSKKADGVSSYASYESGGEQEVVVVASSDTGDLPEESTTQEGDIIPVQVGSGGGSSSFEALYAGG